MLAQIVPIVKPVFGNFTGIVLVVLDLADRTCATLLDDDGIEDANVDPQFMESRRHGLVVATRGLHDYPRVIAEADNVVTQPFKI